MDSEKQLLPIHEHPLTVVAGRSECNACNFGTKAHHFYHCQTCRTVSFHEECITYTPEITHPYHPIHPMKICTRQFGDHADNCFWCNRYMGYAFYRCYICNLNIHLFCASKPQLALTLDDPGNNHHHPLTLFPRKMYFTCNLCARFGEWFPIYACVQCDFMIHKDCIVGLPRVIRISCHEHRISRRLYLTPGKFSCGVCHWEVDPRYGAFLCNKGCRYAVHSRCAISDGVWDKRELQDISEDADELGAVEPYQVIDENHIKHFSHDHNLRFVLNHHDGGGGDDERRRRRRRCRACNLVIQSENFYACEYQCDFILHQECANFPRFRWYMLHPHPLSLKSDADITFSFVHSGRRGFYFCCICSRFSCGFRYVCERPNCHFEVDVRCASIQDELNYECHPHPLFVRLINPNTLTCGICQKASKFVLYCLQCPNYFMCFECATLPGKVAYKHDKHPLILCYGEAEEEEDVKGGGYWCETCERGLDSKQWFYKCDDCGVTLHIPCLLGTSPYAKPGPIMIKAHRSGEDSERIDHYPSPDQPCVEPYSEFIPIRPEEELDVIGNETLSRPLCCHCVDRRCPDFVAFKQEDDFYCSLDCLRNRKLYHDPIISPEIE